MGNTLIPYGTLDDFPGLSQFGDASDIFIDAAVARVRAHVGWHIAPVLTETVTVDSWDGRTWALPTLRLLTVTAIRTDGMTYLPSDFTVHRDGTVELNQWPRYIPHKVPGYRTADIDISHGYTECPPELLPKIAALALTAASTRDPSVSRMVVGQVQMQYDQRAAGSLDGDDVLERYRLPAGVA